MALRLMKIGAFGFLAMLFSNTALYSAPSSEVVKKHMLADLDFIKNSFEIKYAPSLWKKEFADWDVNVAHREAKEKVLFLTKPSIKDCQIILKSFFQTTKDYHVSISFFSTESASLPFMGKSAEGHYYVVYVDPLAGVKNLEVGDEILSFNGRPIMEVIEQLRESEIGNNTAETDQAMAELMLTVRSGSMGHIIPQGEVNLVVRKKGSEKQDTIKLFWDYTPEKILEPILNKPKKLAEPPISCNIVLGKTPKKEIFKAFFNKMMITPTFSNLSSAQVDNTHWLGSKKSYIPELGKVLWKNDEDKIFDAYIFSIKDTTILPPGKKSLQVGYIRIPHYSAGEEEAEEFKELVSFMDFKTDALIIDQINNPGGSIFYMYALASMLTETPLTAPKHKIALTQQEVSIATMILDAMDTIEEGDHQAAQELFGETLGGYEINYGFIENCRLYCEHLINEWNEGHLYTTPIHLYGVDTIKPHSKDRYTKPILVLINSLDFSGGDFFPAILQDNNRATLLGSRTAGAGGYVLGTSYPNLLGVQAFHFTGSLAIRENEDPLENLGVQPDVAYTLTRKDLENDYSSYVRKILEGVCQLNRK